MLVIHAGLPKVASTSLQTYLYNNRVRIALAGIDYHIGINERAAFSLVRELEVKNQTPATVEISNLELSVSAHPSRIRILSAESLFDSRNLRLNLLRPVLETTTSRLIILIREPISHLFSAWTEAIKAGSSVYFHDFVNHAHRNRTFFLGEVAQGWLGQTPIQDIRFLPISQGFPLSGVLPHFALPVDLSIDNPSENVSFSTTELSLIFRSNQRIRDRVTLAGLWPITSEALDDPRTQEAFQFIHETFRPMYEVASSGVPRPPEDSQEITELVEILSDYRRDWCRDAKAIIGQIEHLEFDPTSSTDANLFIESCSTENINILNLISKITQIENGTVDQAVSEPVLRLIEGLVAKSLNLFSFQK